MGTKQKTVDVNIMGRTYKIACADDERDALHAAVEYLDQKMGEIKRAGKITGTERIAVMAALNISHELLSCRESGGGFDIEALKRRMNSMQATLDATLAGEERLL